MVSADDRGMDGNRVREACAPDDRDLDAPQQAEAKAYGHRKLYCGLADTAVSLACLGLVTFAYAQPIDQVLMSCAWLHNRWLRLGGYFLVLIMLQLAVSFPLAAYSGFVLEHQYGLSRQSFGRWLGRYALQNVLIAAFGLALVEGLFLVISLTAGYWWLAAAGASFLVNVLLGQLAPVLILPLFYKVERLDDPELAQRFRRLAEGTGLRIEGVYRMQLSRETVKANAMLAGLGRTRRVILGDTLLEGFRHEEIEVVLAHEIGHHVHRHMLKMMLAGLAFSFAAFFLCDFLVRLYVTRTEGTLDYASLPTSTLPLIMLTVSLFSLLISPAQNALSRHFERQADRYALQRTGVRADFQSAFRRLARLNKADLDPHPLEVILFHDHPPIAERLAMAEEGSAKDEGPRTKDDRS